MHNAAFAAAGIDAESRLAEIDEAEVPGAVAAARGADFLGLGVTAPYKPLVASLVDEVEGDARTIGAVNNVVRTGDGRLIGFNSDAPGFRAGAELAMGQPLAGLDVLVAGAGGAARAAVFACLAANVGRVTVAARDPDRARALLAPWSSVGRSGRRAMGLAGDTLDRALEDVDLAVNATTVGMVDAGMTIPVDELPAHATVFDLVYVPRVTPLLGAAAARGLRTANGEEMLIRQAAIAFERWTGVGGMADVMRAAVAPLLADPTVTA